MKEPETNSITDCYFEPVDIGWRWCKDELPPPFTRVVYDIDEDGEVELASHNNKGTWFDHETGNPVTVVQWCKLPEPLKEGE